MGAEARSKDYTTEGFKEVDMREIRER